MRDLWDELYLLLEISVYKLSQLSASVWESDLLGFEVECIECVAEQFGVCGFPCLVQALEHHEKPSPHRSEYR